MRGEEIQQAEFLIGELHVSPFYPYAAPRRIDVDAVDPDRLAAVGGRQRRVRRRLPRTPEQRARPGDKLADAERLGHVVVGAALEPDHFVRLLTPRGQHEDGHVLVRAPVPDRPAQRQAIDSGNHHVQHQQVEALALSAFERRPTIGQAFACVPFEAQMQAHELANVLVTVCRSN